MNSFISSCIKLILFAYSWGYFYLHCQVAQITKFKVCSRMCFSRWCIILNTVCLPGEHTTESRQLLHNLGKDWSSNSVINFMVKYQQKSPFRNWNSTFSFMCRVLIFEIQKFSSLVLKQHSRVFQRMFMLFQHLFLKSFVVYVNRFVPSIVWNFFEIY